MGPQELQNVEKQWRQNVRKGWLLSIFKNNFFSKKKTKSRHFSIKFYDIFIPHYCQFKKISKFCSTTWNHRVSSSRTEASTRCRRVLAGAMALSSTCWWRLEMSSNTRRRTIVASAARRRIVWWHHPSEKVKIPNTAYVEIPSLTYYNSSSPPLYLISLKIWKFETWRNAGRKRKYWIFQQIFLKKFELSNSQNIN